jgi:hypothetical protein
LPNPLADLPGRRGGCLATYWLVGFACRLAWLGGELAGWVGDGLAGRRAGWLAFGAGWLAGWQAGWLAG